MVVYEHFNPQPTYQNGFVLFVVFAFLAVAVACWVAALLTAAYARMWRLAVASLATPLVQYGWLLIAG